MIKQFLTKALRNAGALILAASLLASSAPAIAQTTYLDRFAGSVTASFGKMPVDAATTGNITLSGYQTVNGVNLNADYMRVLVKNQIDQTKNGIYTVFSGAWMRGTDFSGPSGTVNGQFVYVTGGTQAGLWRLTSPNPVQIDQSGGQSTSPSNITFSNAYFSPLATEGSIASGSTTDIGSVLGTNVVVITGNTAINSFGSSASLAAPIYFVRFASNPVVNYSGSMLLPAARNLITTAGDTATFEYLGGSSWKLLSFQSYVGINGNRVLLDSQTFTAASSVAFTTNFSSVFDTYEFEIYNVYTSNAVALTAQFSTNGGAAYDSALDYKGRGVSSWTQGNVELALGNQAFAYIGVDMADNIAYGRSGEFTIRSPGVVAGGNVNTQWEDRITQTDSGNNIQMCDIQGFWIGAPGSRVNAVLFAPHTGTFTGKITLYGIRNQ